MSASLSRCLALIVALGILTARAMAAEPLGEKTTRLPGVEVRLDRHGDPLPPGAVARLGSQRWRHAGVFRAVFTPDGKKLLSASATRGGKICVWDADTGEKLRQDSLPFDVTSGLLSPDGKHLACGSGVLHLWDVERKEVRRLDGSYRSWVPIAFSPESKLLAAAGREAVYVWDVASGNLVRQISRRPDWSAMSLTLAPGGNVLATGGADHTIVFWDLASGKTIRELANHKGRVTELACSPDGKLLASGSEDGSLRLWEADTGKELAVLARQSPGTARLAFSPDGKFLAATADEKIRLWEVATQKFLREWRAHSNRTSTIAFSPDSKTIVSAEDGSSLLRFWDAATGNETKSLGGHHGPVIKVGFSADGKHILSGGRRDDTVRQWNLDGSGEKILLRWRAWAFLRNGLAFSAGGKLAATGHDDWREARLWSLTDEEPRLLAKLPDAQCLLAFSPDDRLLAAVGRKGVIRLWDTAAGKEMKSFQGTKEPTEEIFAIGLSPDGKTLAVSTYMDRKVGVGQARWTRVWDLETEKLIKSIDDGPFAIFFSGDGKWLADPVRGSFLSIDSGREYRPSDALQNSELVIHSRDGRLQAWCRFDWIRVLESATGREVCRFHEPHSQLYAAAFSPDGRLLVTGHDDSTVLVWDLVGGRLDKPIPLTQAELDAHWSALAGADARAAFQAVWSLALSPRESLAFLQKRLQPIRAAEAGDIEKHIRDLDSDQFAVRNRAVQELEKLEDLAAPGLRKRLEERPSLEVERRIQNLLGKLELPITGPERLRAVRVVAVLEQMATPEAGRVLQTLAQGAPGAMLTCEAQLALQRLRAQGATERPE